jgi:hypothetical protein
VCDREKAECRAGSVEENPSRSVAMQWMWCNLAVALESGGR